MKGYVIPLGRRVDTRFQRLFELGEIAIPPPTEGGIIHRVSIVVPCDGELEDLADGLEIAARALSRRRRASQMSAEHLERSAGLVGQWREALESHVPAIGLRFLIESSRVQMRVIPGGQGYSTAERVGMIEHELVIPYRLTRGALADLLETLVVALRDPET